MIVILDANALYPAILRDLLMRLAGGLLYSPRFTDTIHEEWIRNVLKDRPDLTATQLERTRQLMNQIDSEALVVGYEPLIVSLTLPDPDDRHVLAAAIHTKATIIVTFNLRDFPVSILSTFGVEAVHPDIFLCRLFDEKSDTVLERLRRHRAALQNPPKTPERFVAGFRINSLPRFADRLESYLDKI